MIATLIALIGFSIGWAACLYGVVHDLIFFGPGVVLFLFLCCWFYVCDSNKAAQVIFRIACWGTVIESAQAYFPLTRIYVPAGQNGGVLTPLWVTTMWINFGIFLVVWLAPRLRDKIKTTVVLGMVAGPASYLLAAYFNGITIWLPGHITIALLSVLWAFQLPLLVSICNQRLFCQPEKRR